MSVSLDDFSERVITPAMPPRLASACCISNFIIPGSGTLVSGFAVFCCSKNSDMDTGDKVTTCACSLAIGLLQLALSAFILVGWCWSCVWGLHYVQMSKKHYPEGWGLDQPTNVRTSQPTRGDVTSFLSAVHRQGHPQPVLPPPYSHCVDPPPPYESIYQQFRADSYPGS